MHWDEQIYWFGMFFAGVLGPPMTLPHCVASRGGLDPEHLGLEHALPSTSLGGPSKQALVLFDLATRLGALFGAFQAPSGFLCIWLPRRAFLMIFVPLAVLTHGAVAAPHFRVVPGPTTARLEALLLAVKPRHAPLALSTTRLSTTAWS